MYQFQHLEDQLAAAPDEAARLDVLNELAQALTRAGNAERALPLAREAVQLATARGDHYALALALCNIGMSQYLCADYTDGLDNCLRAFVIAERADKPDAIASALISAGACQYQMGSREEALQALYQALEVIEADAEPRDQLSIRVHNALGIILCDKGRFDDSETHYRKALEIGSSSDDVIYTPRVKMNYAGLHHQRGLLLDRNGNNPGAQAHYRAGIELCEQLSTGHGLGGAFNQAHCAGTLGELYRELGETERALGLFGEMLAHGTEMNNPHQQAEALMNLGKTQMALGDAPAARQLLDRSVELAAGANVRRLIADAFLGLAAWFEAAGDFKTALEHHKRYHALHEELLRTELHAAGKAHQIWLKFQQLRREVKIYRERTELLSRDNGELSERADRLARHAHEDSLTGLSNRRYLDMRLSEFIASANEFNLRLCIAIVDIDHFKGINDSCSHAVGDAVLRTVAGMIRAHCREGDLSARYGGDEFVICLVGTPLEATGLVFERLCNVVANHQWTSVHPGLRVTLSIGVTEIEANDTVTTLMHRVDSALYGAKRAGRNRVMAV